MAMDSTAPGARPPAIALPPTARPPELDGRRRGPRRHRFVKDWDRYVAQIDELSRTPSFGALRDTILDHAAPRAHERALDVGTGTGLLALPLAGRARWVWALDISAPMVERVRASAADAGLRNVTTLVGSATSLALEDGSVDLAVSNYCFHHLDRAEKRQALQEVYRVLAPGGRLVFGDMMFEVSVRDRRDRAIIREKVRALLRKGPGGLLRLARSAARAAVGAGERPAAPVWWLEAMVDAGFTEVAVDLLEHESGIAIGRKPR